MTKLEDVLKAHVVNFTFIKANGELRQAKATMRAEYLPAPKPVTNPNLSRPTPEENLLFWDVEKNAFRSCKKERIVGEFEIID